MMNKSKIDWTDFTWNPVTGCPRGCYYCYAAKQARRFCGDIRLNKSSPQITRTAPDAKTYILEQPFRNDAGRVIPFPAGFAPTLHRYRLPMPAQKKKPANIFVCSMGDLFAPQIPTRWIVDVFDACAAAPWHTYLFLTKYPERYRELEQVALLPHAENFWYGTTVTRQADTYRLADLPAPPLHRFASVEPLLEAVNIAEASDTPPIDWLIVGAETGNQKGKHAPSRAWLEAIQAWASTNGVPVLFKESAELYEAWGSPIPHQFPEGITLNKPDVIPHCDACEFCYTVDQGKRGKAYFCVSAWADEGYPDRGDRHIPGRYTRTSPPWCPRRKEGAGDEL